MFSTGDCDFLKCCQMTPVCVITHVDAFNDSFLWVCILPEQWLHGWIPCFSHQIQPFFIYWQIAWRVTHRDMRWWDPNIAHNCGCFRRSSRAARPKSILNICLNLLFPGKVLANLSNMMVDKTISARETHVCDQCVPTIANLTEREYWEPQLFFRGKLIPPNHWQWHFLIAFRPFFFFGPDWELFQNDIDQCFFLSNSHALMQVLGMET